MKVVIDLNFGRSWVETLERDSIEAIHWSAIGPLHAPDTVILAWAKANSAIVLTQDLDYADILAASGAAAPSVLLVRGAEALAASLRELIVQTLHQCSEALASGAIVVLDARGARVRTLPIK